MERKMKSQLLEAEVFNLKRMLYLEQNKGNRTSLVWASLAVRHTPTSWWWCGPGGASLPGRNRCGRCCFRVRAIWLGHISDSPAPVKFIFVPRYVFTFSLEKMSPEKRTQLLVLRLKMLTQQLVVMCDQPLLAVGAWDFKTVLLLRSFCTAEQALHKTQSRFSDSDCKKYH